MKRFGSAPWSGAVREGKGSDSWQTHERNVELDAGHLSLVSHPKEIANLILAVAGRRN
jgi:hypothetical protein